VNQILAISFQVMGNFLIRKYENRREGQRSMQLVLRGLLWNHT